MNNLFGRGSKYEQRNTEVKKKKEAETVRATVEELGNITKSKGVLLEMKAKVIHTLIFPITRYECKSWMVKKADRKKKEN